jgi:hypothetical protein
VAKKLCRTVWHGLARSARDSVGLSAQAQQQANTLAYGDQRRLEIALALALCRWSRPLLSSQPGHQSIHRIPLQHQSHDGPHLVDRQPQGLVIQKMAQKRVNSDLAPSLTPPRDQSLGYRLKPVETGSRA